MDKEEFKIQICEEIETLFGGFINMDGYDRSRVRTIADNILAKIPDENIEKGLEK